MSINYVDCGGLRFNFFQDTFEFNREIFIKKNHQRREMGDTFVSD